MSLPTPPRRIDWPSAAMAVVTTLALAWFAWQRLESAGQQGTPRVGAVPPTLRLVDVETNEPLLLFGLRGKVVWVTFWSADDAAGALLEALGKIDTRLRARGRFSMVAVAVDREQPAAVRAVAGASRVPVYLATPQTLHAYGAAPGRLPLHVLIDDDGRIGAIAQGGDPATVARLARQAEDWLDALEPFGGARFATNGPRPERSAGVPPFRGTGNPPPQGATPANRGQISCTLTLR